jgi:hypothetical protein
MPNNDINEHNSCSARMYGQSGALKDLLEKVDDPKINDLEDVLRFRKDYAVVRQKKVDDSVAQVKVQISEMLTEINRLKLESEELIKGKSEELNQTISRLDGELTLPDRKCNFVAGLYRKIKRWARGRKITYLKKNYQMILQAVAKNSINRIASLDNKIKNTQDNVQRVAEENISRELRRLDEINNTLESEKYLIYGAIGETDVINELKKLPKTYHVINDLRAEFNPPIYNRSENDRIYSIQVDTLVVGPTGLFIIETKYWSKKSISSETLFSPVKQVKRAGFALFVRLNGAVKSGRIAGLVNNWGERKISLRQIVASVNAVPHAEFQYVKVLGIEKLNSYITYGKQEFTSEQIQEIVDYLIQSSTPSGTWTRSPRRCSI